MEVAKSSIKWTDFILLRSPRQEIKGKCPPAVYGKRRYKVVNQYGIILILDARSRLKEVIDDLLPLRYKLFGDKTVGENTIMDLDRNALQKQVHELYAREHEELRESGTVEHLERGRQWQLSGTLSEGGVLVFPHAGVHDCGYQIAACVHAALDSGAEKVVLLSVLHAFSQAMENARVAVANGVDPAHSEYWGIQGPGIDGRLEWTGDHALISWRHFWQAELKRRGISEANAPKVYERYPYLVGGRPQDLPGIDAFARLMEDAVVVSTADPFHHGIGYGDAPQETYDHDSEGLAHAKSVIESGIRILETGDYRSYERHCIEAKSDARDTGQVYRYLRGPMRGEVLDLSFTDTTELYGAPKPTWVAGALTEWKLSI